MWFVQNAVVDLSHQVSFIPIIQLRIQPNEGCTAYLTLSQQAKKKIKAEVVLSL